MDDARAKLRARLRAQRDARVGGGGGGHGRHGQREEAVMRAVGDDAQALQIASVLMRDPGKVRELTQALNATKAGPREEEEEEEEEAPPPVNVPKK